ncbi:MAG: GDSL-type esterase/lipase family protein [Gemmatimonadaceae bacterium]
MRFLLLLVAFFFTATGCYVQTTAPQRDAVAVQSESRFESEIRAFEDADRAEHPKSGGVVFVGSSSIRLWPDLHADFPGINVIQRGFGGSRLDEVVHYTPRIVLAYKPTLIVLYAGDNDLAEGRTPEQVFNDYKAFVATVRKALPETRIAYISIKPSGDRWALVDEMRVTNSMIQAYAARDSKLTYVDVFTSMLGTDGKPREELFREDRLHMNDRGYAIWRELLTPIVTVVAAQLPQPSH